MVVRLSAAGDRFRVCRSRVSFFPGQFVDELTPVHSTGGPRFPCRRWENRKHINVLCVELAIGKKVYDLPYKNLGLGFCINPEP